MIFNLNPTFCTARFHFENEPQGGGRDCTLVTPLSPGSFTQVTDSITWMRTCFIFGENPEQLKSIYSFHILFDAGNNNNPPAKCGL